MDNDLYRAGLALACVLAVVVGASLFPATGFGTNPVPAGGVANGSGQGPGGTGGPGDATTVPASDDSSSDGETSTSDASEGAASATTTPSDADESGVGTTTRTTTEPPTTSPAGSGAASDGGLEGSILAFVAIFLTSGVFVAVAAIGFGRHHRRRHPGEWDLPSAPHLRVLAYVRRIPQTSLSFAMFAGSNAPRVLDGLVAEFENATAGIGAATSGLATVGSSLGRGLAAVPMGVASSIGGLGRALGSLTLDLGALTSLRSTSVLGGGANRPGDDPRSGASEQPEPADPEPPDPPASVREAFDRLQEDLGVSGRDGRTPGEIARRAIDRGLPTDAIAALTSAFRDVRYGGYPDDGERVAVARDAYERVRDALEGESS